MKKAFTITKEKVSEKLQGELGFSNNLCDEITSVIFDEIFQLTQRDGKVMLQNFGTWQINHKESRPGFDIRSGNKVEVTPRRVFRFLPSRTLKTRIKIT